MLLYVFFWLMSSLNCYRPCNEAFVSVCDAIHLYILFLKRTGNTSTFFRQEDAQEFLSFIAASIYLGSACFTGNHNLLLLEQ
jgi:hypothetical protein